jgi:hypothetical protein
MVGLIFIAALAGIASALLAASAAAGSMLGAILMVVAPLPLMIVAIGWHPLLALIGGALTSALLALLFRGSAGLMFAVLVMIPAYLAAWTVWRRPLDGPPLVGLLVMGGALYAAFATLVGAFSISFDFTVLEQQLVRQSELMYRVMSGLGADAPLTPVSGRDPKVFISAMADAVGPFVAFMLGAIYIFNIWLAAKIAGRSGRLPGPWVPVPDMLLPRVLMPVAALSMLGGLLPGYLGFVLELISVASILALIALGYASMHAVSRGSSLRGLMLGTLWSLTLIFGFPVLLMLLAGVAELSFGWRRSLSARRSNT